MTKDDQNIWIIGTGAVGSTLAALLTRFAAARVTLVGASDHWRRISDQGLRFEIAGAEFKTETAAEPEANATVEAETIPIATAAPSELPRLTESDLVLLTGKLPRLGEAVTLLQKTASAQTPIVALQNGFKVDAIVAEALNRPIDRGLIMFGTFSREPGCVTYFPGKVLFRPTATTDRLSKLLQPAPLECLTSEDFNHAEWSKLAVNCLANPLAGLLNKTNAELAATELNPVKEAILSEIRAVAAASGIELQMTLETFNRYLTGPTGGNIASLRCDLERGQVTEIDHLNGFIAREAEKHDLDAPINRFITHMIHYLSATKMI